MNDKRPIKLTSLVTLLVATQLTPAACFGVVQQQPPTVARRASRQYFRNDEALFEMDSLLKQQRSAEETTQLPAWLARSKSHRLEANMSQLQEDMRRSFFTETETLKLVYALEEASAGDRSLMSGAAEFCSILVETMEMGLNALVAGAFHYCAAFEAREQALDKVNIQPALADFGAQAQQIAQDAAHLKELEMVASRVMRSDASRVRPDGKDAENLRKLLLSETHDWRGLAIRSAACLFRLRGLETLSSEGMRAAREALLIYAPLASRLGMHRLKNELEGTAFKILYPRQYERVSESAHQPTMQAVLAKVQDDLKARLDSDAEFNDLTESFSVTARVKEPYSMWRKMLRNKYTSILQVPDALALRVVLDAKKQSPEEPVELTRARERALCYYAQNLSKDVIKPLEGNSRFKDYVASPKKNGYQSLHYTGETQFQGKDWKIEIQVRSGEMHQVAEFGLASHWDYKSEQTRSTKDAFPSEERDVLVDHSSDAYLRKVQEWQWKQHAATRQMDTSAASFEPVALSDIWQSKVRAERIRARTERLEPYIQALSMAQSDLAREFVFVFLTQSEDEQPLDGKVLALPSGACVLDALREGERALGCPLTSYDKDLVLNGAHTSVTRQLSNGDVLTLPAMCLN